MMNAVSLTSPRHGLSGVALPIVSLTLLFAGMVMTLQIVDILLRYGAQSTLGGVMSVAMGRELGPILTGVVMAGHVGAAMTAKSGP